MPSSSSSSLSAAAATVAAAVDALREQLGQGCLLDHDVAALLRPRAEWLCAAAAARPRQQGAAMDGIVLRPAALPVPVASSPAHPSGKRIGTTTHNVWSGLYKKTVRERQDLLALMFPALIKGDSAGRGRGGAASPSSRGASHGVIDASMPAHSGDDACEADGTRSVATEMTDTADQDQDEADSKSTKSGRSGGGRDGDAGQQLHKAKSENRSALRDGLGSLPLEIADVMVENVVGVLALPMGVVPNVIINGRTFVVPMAVEEPSIVAAASGACKLIAKAALSGGFSAAYSGNIMTGQIQVLDLPPVPGDDALGSAALAQAAARIEASAGELRARANAAIPRMVARGGGVVKVFTRKIPAHALTLDGVVCEHRSGSAEPSSLSCAAGAASSTSSSGPFHAASLLQQQQQQQQAPVHMRVAPVLVVHLDIDVCEAMGANTVNTVAEAVADVVARVTGGRVGLRILSNLCVERRARARFAMPIAKLGWKGCAGADVARKVVDAYTFAAADPFRACTNNKGIMNGIDAVAVASGQDWRALEAGAHAFAASPFNANNRAMAAGASRSRGEGTDVPVSQTGGGSGGSRDGGQCRYTSLTQYSIQDIPVRPVTSGDASASSTVRCLVGEIELPVAVGTKGGALQTHPGYRRTHAILGHPTCAELAGIIAAVGLAQNFAALRALAVEGIQKGHMGLHARNIAVAAGVPPALVPEVATYMQSRGDISQATAAEYLQAHVVYATLRAAPKSPPIRAQPPPMPAAQPPALSVEAAAAASASALSRDPSSAESSPALGPVSATITPARVRFESAASTTSTPVLLPSTLYVRIPVPGVADLEAVTLNVAFETLPPHSRNRNTSRELSLSPSPPVHLAVTATTTGGTRAPQQQQQQQQQSSEATSTTDARRLEERRWLQQRLMGDKGYAQLRQMMSVLTQGLRLPLRHASLRPLSRSTTTTTATATATATTSASTTGFAPVSGSPGVAVAAGGAAGSAAGQSGVDSGGKERANRPLQSRLKLLSVLINIIADRLINVPPTSTAGHDGTRRRRGREPPLSTADVSRAFVLQLLRAGRVSKASLRSHIAALPAHAGRALLEARRGCGEDVEAGAGESKGRKERKDGMQGQGHGRELQALRVGLPLLLALWQVFEYNVEQYVAHTNRRLADSLRREQRAVLRGIVLMQTSAPQRPPSAFPLPRYEHARRRKAADGGNVVVEKTSTENDAALLAELLPGRCKRWQATVSMLCDALGLPHSVTSALVTTAAAAKTRAASADASTDAGFAFGSSRAELRHGRARGKSWDDGDAGEKISSGGAKEMSKEENKKAKKANRFHDRGFKDLLIHIRRMGALLEAAGTLQHDRARWKRDLLRQSSSAHAQHGDVGLLAASLATSPRASINSSNIVLLFVARKLAQDEESRGGGEGGGSGGEGEGAASGTGKSDLASAIPVMLPVFDRAVEEWTRSAWVDLEQHMVMNADAAAAADGALLIGARVFDLQELRRSIEIITAHYHHDDE